MVSIKQKVQSNAKQKTTKAMKIKPAQKIATKVIPTKEIVDAKKKIKRKYVMPCKSVTEDLLASSINVLRQLTVKLKKKNTIFEDELPIFVSINCIKIQNTKGNIKFVFPHSTVTSTGEVCLITPDLKKGRKIDHEPTVDHWEDILQKADITSVKTVLPMRQLRVEYDQYELKRRLLTQHDFIMVDTRVLNHVSHLLGKMFFKKHNMLIPVRLNENGNIRKHIDMGLRTAMLRLSEGPTSTITVGHTGMSDQNVKENITSLIQQLPEKFPGGEANIRSISLKLPLSLSLPLYMTLRPTNSVYAPKLKQKKPKHFTLVEDELSTIPGSTVRVAPDGTVHLVKVKKSEISDMEEDPGNKKNETEESDMEEE